MRHLWDRDPAWAGPGTGPPPHHPAYRPGHHPLPRHHCRSRRDARGMVWDAEHARYLRSVSVDGHRAADLCRETTLLLVRRGRDGRNAGRNLRGPARDLPGGPDRHEPGIHRCCGPFPAAVRVPAEAYPAGYEGGHGCRDRGIREERAGQESLLDPVHLDGRAGPGPGRRPGDSSADSRADYGAGGITPFFTRKISRKVNRDGL